MEPVAVDQIQINLSTRGLMIINGAIGLMMLGVALELKFEDFKRILQSPKAPIIGLLAQFILLPAFTFLLTLLIKPQPSVALGMILLAACPGGNFSNLMTYLAKGNCALSISMTAISTVAAIFMTPLNLSLWGGLNPHTAAILKQVSLSPMDVFVTVFIILGIPLVVGMTLSRMFPGLAVRVRKPFKIFTLIFFIIILCGAFAANWKIFLQVIGLVVFVVFIHNAMALNLGYWSGRLARLPEADCRAVSIEVGIQNAALGLVLVFTFFQGLGGMAIVVGWWGIWHIVAGLITAYIFTRRRLPGDEDAMQSCSRV
jgi:bile acid:Na+ symporter, BASS family